GDVDLWSATLADPLAIGEQWRIAALADHDLTGDIDAVERFTHGEDGSLVGFHLAALAAPARRRDRRALGDPGDFQRQIAVDRRVFTRAQLVFLDPDQ